MKVEATFLLFIFPWYPVKKFDSQEAKKSIKLQLLHVILIFDQSSLCTLQENLGGTASRAH